MVGTERRTFRAMGTDVCIIVGAGQPVGDAARIAERVFAREELRFSRFRPESELSTVNRMAGVWTLLSHGFAALTAFALEAARRTDGRFDPTVLPAIVAAGYDRDFDEVLAGARSALHPPRPCGRWREIELEHTRLRMPQGVGLDLGGVAKGWTVDRAAEAIVAAGVPWSLVNAGGDLRIAGRPPGPGIDVSIEDPEDPSTPAGTLWIRSGALATSSVTRRAWGPGRHHLIDPKTGRPSQGPVLQATVWAPTCAEAEVASKDALLEGRPFLERGAAAMVLRDGPILTSFAPEVAA
jgi:thiamine biosynthesis lipoprotein